jgi:hypothetical protein
VKPFDLAAYLAGRPHRRTGVPSEWVLACPRCAGREHLYVNVDKRCGHCFRCGWSPGLVELLAELEGRSSAEIASRLQAPRFAERPALEALRARNVQAGVPGGRGNSKQCIDWPREYISLAITHDPSVESVLVPLRAYVAHRGIPHAAVVRHRIGCALIGRYANRLILPILTQGRLVALQARDIVGASPAKYIGPAGARLGDHLFNVDRARQFDQIVLCEGIISAIHTGEDAVASFGKALTARQLALLVDTGKPVVVLYDAAKDGGAAAADAEAWSAAEAIHRAGLLAFVGCLPRGDPADNSIEVVRSAIAGAESYDPLRRLRGRLG